MKPMTIAAVMDTVLTFIVWPSPRPVLAHPPRLEMINASMRPRLLNDHHTKRIIKKLTAGLLTRLQYFVEVRLELLNRGVGRR